MRLFSKKQAADDDNVDIQGDHEWWAADQQAAAAPPPPFDPAMASAVSPTPPADDTGWFMPDLELSDPFAAPAAAPVAEVAESLPSPTGLPAIGDIPIEPLPSDDTLGALTRQALDPSAPAPGLPAALSSAPPDPLLAAATAPHAAPAAFDPPPPAADPPPPAFEPAPMTAAPAAMAADPTAMTIDPSVPPAPAPAVAPATAAVSAVPAGAIGTPAPAGGSAGPRGDAAVPLLAQLGLADGASWDDVAAAHRSLALRVSEDPHDPDRRALNQTFAALRLLAVA